MGDVETSKQILFQAADLIEERGWMQGAMSDGKRFCAVGAIRSICDNSDRDDLYDDVLMLFTQCLAERRVIDPGYTITSWNDKLSQTKENVVNTMRDCANGG